MTCFHAACRTQGVGNQTPKIRQRGVIASGRARDGRKRLELGNLSAQPCGLTNPARQSLASCWKRVLRGEGVTLPAKRRQQFYEELKGVRDRVIHNVAHLYCRDLEHVRRNIAPSFWSLPMLSLPPKGLDIQAELSISVVAGDPAGQAKLIN